MAELPEVFNAKDEETIDDGFTPIPSGWYPAQIVKSELLKTKNKKGSYLKLEFKVIDGDYVGRPIWKQLNLVNENVTTVQIAKRELASICKALDLESVLDSTELHGQPMMIHVNIKPGTGGYDPKNDIKNYKSIDDSEVNSDDDIPF